MGDLLGLFDQFAAALQFPYYFGYNWAALDECMSDVSWLPGREVIVAVFDAAQLLPDDDDARALLELLSAASVSLSTVDVLRAEPRVLRVVLQESERSFGSLTDRLGRLGYQPTSIQ